MARLPARRSQPSGSHANPRSSSVPERKRARIVEFNSGHLKPFDYGFRREMVVRGTVPGQDGGRIMSDIYYYTPTGTKLCCKPATRQKGPETGSRQNGRGNKRGLRTSIHPSIQVQPYDYKSPGITWRSMPEVSAYLAKNRKLPLTADNFNFKRATIHQPPHEVVRNAGPRHSGKFKSARVTRQSAPAALEPASPVPASPAAVPALPASAVEHAKSLCAATLSGRRKARKPLCGCCESRHEWHQQVHKDAPGHHHLHRAASKKWPGHGVPQAYRRAPKPTVVPSGRRSQPPVAQNTTYAKVPADESAAHTEDTKGGEPEESSVAYESPRKSVSPSKLQQVTEECAVQPSVRHAVVLVNDILKPEVGEKAASDADRVLATPKACADSWQNATARELYRVLTRWQNASEQAAATATEDDLLGDPVIIKEGTEPLGASPALDPEGSSVLSSQSKPAAVSREPCTARCSRATGETPELQCKRCLCFFHPICIGLSHLATTKGRFVCKACTKLPYKSAQKSTSLKQPRPSEIAPVNCKPISSVATQSLTQDLKETFQDPGPGSFSPASVPATAAAPFPTCSSVVVSSSPSAAPLTFIRPSCSVTNSVLPMVLSSAGTISVPVVHLVANGAAPKRPSFTSTSMAPAVARTTPGPLTMRPVRAPSGGRHSLPPLLPSPPSSAALAAATAKPPKISSLRIQSTGGQDVTVCPSAYYTIHLAQKTGSISNAALKSIVSQLVQKHPEELQKRASAGQSIILQAQPVQQEARSLLQPAIALPEKQKVQQHCPPASMAAGSGDCTSTQLLAVSTAPETSPARKVELETVLPVGTRQFSANATPATVGTCDSGLDTSAVSIMPMVTSSGTRSQISSVAKVSSPSQQETSHSATCQEFVSGAMPLAVHGQQTALPRKSQNGKALAASTTAEMGPQIVPKVEPDMELAPAVEETVSIHVIREQETVVNGGPSSLYVGSSSCEPVTKVESVPQAFIATDKSDAFHSVSPLPGCPFVISSSYSLAGKEVSERDSSSPAECDGKEQAPGASMDQAYVVVTKDRCSGNGSDTSDLKMAYEIGHIWPATSHMGSESEDGSAHVSTKATSVRVEQKEPSDKFPSGNSGSVCEVLRNKRRHHFVTLPEPPGISLWLSSGGRLTCVHDRQDSIGANTVEPDHSVSGSVVLFNSVPDSASSMRGFTDMFTVLTEIFKWLPTPTLCKTAQVSRAWRKLSAMSDSVLERDSLEPVLCRITMLDTVKHVALEVNPLQLARVARAFPHLHSISALISRRGCSLRPPTTAVFVLDRGRRERRQCVCTRMLFITLAKNTRSRPASYKTSTSTAEPRHPASLGGLSELLCVAGLERLELRGAHGLAILPLTMSPNCLAQRCHQLRALSLVTVQNMTPEVVFLISLLHGLEELHLGECIKWSETSFLNISKLKKLRRLTLEHGEDKSGFRSMLLRLSNLERLELKQWTLRNSLADTLPHMTLLRHLLLCPVNGDLASKTNRNVLRSCLAAGATLKQITWVVSCKSSTSPQGVFDLNLAFEPGNLCDCPSIIAASNPADVPVSTPGGSLRNADISPEAQEVASGHLQCCAFAKKFRHMWKPSLHLAWYMTVRQVCQGLKRCLGPHTAVCFCAQVEQ
ncbi:uncharacterized protein LOC144132256 isoform X2 [Amblyomma americanum]